MTEDTSQVTGHGLFLPFARWNKIDIGLIWIFTVGLTTIWKFPYSMYMYSGLFLVAYYTLFVLIVAPVLWIQFRLGQVYRKGLVILLPHFMPLAKGVGYVLLVWVFIHAVSHNVLLSHCVYFMIACLRKHSFPWEIHANSSSNLGNLAETDSLFFGRSPAEDYYYDVVLGLTSPGIQWKLALCLMALTFLTFGSISQGSATVKKVLYGSAAVSLVFLLIIVVYSLVAMPTAKTGLSSLFHGNKPSVLGSAFIDGSEVALESKLLQSELSSPPMWVNALDLHVVSLGLWTAVLPTLGAHAGNRMRKTVPNLMLVCIVLVLFLSVPYLLAMVMSPLLQALTPKQHRMLQEATHPGSALLFVAIPDAFSNLSCSPYFASMFYLCVIVLALNYQIVILLVIFENVVENLPKNLLKRIRRPEVLSGGLCIFMFLLGLPLISHVGMMLLRMLDQYLYRLLFIPVLLCLRPLATAFVRINPLHIPVERMGMAGWFVAAGIGTVLVQIYQEVEVRSQQLAYLWWPTWLHVLGHLVSVAILIICIIAGITHAFFNTKGRIKQRFIKLLSGNREDLRTLPGCFPRETLIDVDDVVYQVAPLPSQNDKQDGTVGTNLQLINTNGEATHV